MDLMTIYLDNAATTWPKPESVYQAMDKFARESMANPGRSGHSMAKASEKVLEDARVALNRFFEGASPDRWAFTLNCTDALNMAIKGVLNDGDHVITTDLEHNSVNRPIRSLELSGRISVTKIASDDGGTLDPQAIAKAFTPKTKLVVVTHASNVLGTVQPIEEIARITRENDALILVDAAQTAGLLPISLDKTPIDLLAFPGHKALMGPTGTGALYIGPRVTIRPWREGGTGGDSKTEIQPTDYPYFLEGGTPNIMGISGLLAGIKWVTQQGIEKIHQHENALAKKLSEGIANLPGIRMLGHQDWSKKVATVSFTIEGLEPYEMGNILDSSFAIAIRPGLHCAPYIHGAQSTFPDGAVRASLGPFNTEEDINALIGALKEVVGA